MKHQPVVVVLGHSLLMDGVAISLKNMQMNNIIRVDPDITDIKVYLQSLQPDLVILELNDPRADFIPSLLKATPDIIFLGINEDCSRTLVLKTHERVIHTMQDFHELLQQALHRKPRLFKGGRFTEYQKKPDV